MDRPLTLPWLLVASPQLTDSSFQRAVVLVVETSRHGTMGFVINRPIQAPHGSLADLVSVPNVTIPRNVPAWYGGPVERGTGIILHKTPAPGAKTQAPKPSVSYVAFDGLALSSSGQTLNELIDYSVRRSEELEEGAPSAKGDSAVELGLYPYRFLIGYAGWGPDQLEDELRQGTWIQAPATQQLIFHTPWKSMWDAALGEVGANPRTLVPAAQPYLN